MSKFNDKTLIRRINTGKLLTCVFCMVLTRFSACPQAPFSRGVNLTGWFQANSPGQIQLTKYTRQDMVNIKSLGCDGVRLPVNLHSMTLGGPSYSLDPVFVTFLDSVIDLCEELDIYLILDNHSFDPVTDTSPDIEYILKKVWSQMARHLKDRSDLVLYEILNEPHGISTSVWGAIQGEVINTIRTIDTKHTIIVGGSGFNSYNEMKNLPVYSDNNLLYTFHFYDPFMFTHQGASWTEPSMEPLAGVPFPYNQAGMPSCPAALKGTWIESSLNNYPSDGTVARVHQLIDIAVNFRNSRKVNIFCGEFGVYIPNSSNTGRSYWYNVVRQYLDEKNIPWTIWDYQGGFGLFNKDSNELFDHDLNIGLLQSLGFDIPPQTPFVISPETNGFPIYSDFICDHISDGSYGTGRINFYSTDLPNNGKYNILWQGFGQYNAIVFNFKPFKDLTELEAEGYAIDFMVRGNKPDIKFDIRFIDTKTGPQDHPWRMGITIDNTLAEWDRKWHHAHIPLSELSEKGSWDNNSWFNPEGKFDWAAVERFEISSEYPVSSGQYVWFDNIHITNLDTALVREGGIVSAGKIPELTLPSLRIAPNPVRNHTLITYELAGEDQVTLSICTLSGVRIRTLDKGFRGPGITTLEWNGCTESGKRIGQGMYICVLTTSRFSVSCRLLVVN